MINGSIALRAIIGAIWIIPIANYGRRTALMIVAIVFTIGTGITMIFNFYSLALGRFIMGVAAGAFTSISPLYITEIAPTSISGTLGTLNQFMASFGVMIANSLAFMVPYKENLTDSNFEIWRVVFVFPAIISILQLLLLLFVFRLDTPKYYQITGDNENRRKIMEKIYSNYDEGSCSNFKYDFLLNSYKFSWIIAFNQMFSLLLKIKYTYIHIKEN